MKENDDNKLEINELFALASKLQPIADYYHHGETWACMVEKRTYYAACRAFNAFAPVLFDVKPDSSAAKYIMADVARWICTISQVNNAVTCDIGLTVVRSAIWSIEPFLYELANKK